MIAWNRVRAWKTVPDAEFRKDFVETIRVADILQPVLLVITLGATLWFIAISHGAAQVMAYISAVTLAAILVASVTIMVPLQNRMMAAYKTKTSDTNELQEMKSRWLTGHTARSALSMIALLLLAVTVALSK